MGKSSPSAPNPYTTAQAQTASNSATAAQQQAYDVQDANATAALNRVGQTNAAGSTLSYGSNGQQTTTLSPSQQGLYDSATGAASSALGNFNATPNSPSTIPQPILAGSSANYDNVNIQNQANNPVTTPIQTSVSNPVTQAIQGQVGVGGTDGLVTQESQALTNSILAQLQPTTSAQTQALQTQLANQGLTPGSTAYNNAMLQNSQSINNLELGAVSSGAAEQQQEYTQALDNANFANSAQQQGYTQGLDSAQLANAGQQQGFTEGLDNAQLSNAGQQQGFTEGLDEANLYNSTTQQGFTNAITAGDYGDQQYLLPIQAAASLQSIGNSAASPQFASVPQVSVNAPSVSGTNVSSLVNSSYQDQVAQAQANNSTLGGLLGTLGTAGLGLTGGYSGLAGLLGIGASSADPFAGAGTSY